MPTASHPHQAPLVSPGTLISINGGLVTPGLDDVEDLLDLGEGDFELVSAMELPASGSMPVVPMNGAPITPETPAASSPDLAMPDALPLPSSTELMPPPPLPVRPSHVSPCPASSALPSTVSPRDLHLDARVAQCHTFCEDAPLPKLTHSPDTDNAPSGKLDTSPLFPPPVSTGSASWFSLFPEVALEATAGATPSLSTPTTSFGSSTVATSPVAPAPAPIAPAAPIAPVAPVVVFNGSPMPVSQPTMMPHPSQTDPLPVLQSFSPACPPRGSLKRPRVIHVPEFIPNVEPPKKQRTKAPLKEIPKDLSKCTPEEKKRIQNTVAARESRGRKEADLHALHQKLSCYEQEVVWLRHVLAENGFILEDRR